MNTLREMPRWDWDDYFARLERKGFEHFCRRESENNEIRGYCLFWGNSSIPANEIDRGLTWGKIEGTWRKLRLELLQQSQGNSRATVRANSIGAPSTNRWGNESGSQPSFVDYDYSSILPSFRNNLGGTCYQLRNRSMQSFRRRLLFLMPRTTRTRRLPIRNRTRRT